MAKATALLRLTGTVSSECVRGGPGQGQALQSLVRARAGEPGPRRSTILCAGATGRRTSIGGAVLSFLGPGLLQLSQVHAASQKRAGLTLTQLRDVLAEDVTVRHYFITGDLSQDIYADDCLFVDPTTSVKGVSAYVAVASTLFDRLNSIHSLRDIQVTGPREITSDWELGGYLTFGWHPRVPRFRGQTVYRINDQGLVQSHIETWSITPFDALLQTILPSAGPGAAPA